MKQNSEFRTNDLDKKNQNSYETNSANQKSDEYSYFFNKNEYHIDIEIVNEKIYAFKCRRCKTKFFFSNKLHRHIRECRKSKVVELLESHQIDVFHIDNLSDRIIIFRVKSDFIKDLIFWTWHFVIFFARIFKDESLNELCVDTECIMSFIDKVYLMKRLSHVKMHHINVAVRIRDIDIVIHNCSKYVHLKLFISKFTKIVKLTRQTHVVNNLRVKFLMKINILESKKAILNISQRKMILSLCENLKIFIRVTLKLETRVNRVILVERLVIISTKSIATVSTRMRDKFLSERDYLFQSISRELNLESVDEVMTHIMSVNVVAMQVCNFIEKSVIISRRARLDRIIEYEEHECYLIDLEEISLAIESTWKKWKSFVVSTRNALLVAEYFTQKSVAMTNIHVNMKNISSKSMKEIFVDEITIYETSKIRQRLFITINEFKSSLWDKIENIMMNVFENEWMSITLKSDVKIETTKVYSMNSSEKDLIDETFNKLHE